METVDELKRKTGEELEEWLAQALSREPVPLDQLREMVDHFRTQGNTAQAETWCELILESLGERQDQAGMLRLLQDWLASRGEDEDLRDRVTKALVRGFKDRSGQAAIASVGMESGTPLAEIVRRLSVLIQLRPGTPCYDRTWGYGVVKDVNDFYRKATVNFDKKSSHPMSYSYAAEALQIVTPDHILARHRSDRAALSELFRSDPAEVVRIALRSYGAVSVARMRELFVQDGVLADADWKAFWDGARKGLRHDPYIEIPAKRSDPIVVRRQVRDPAAERKDRLASERDLPEVLRLVEDVLRGATKYGEQMRLLARDRLLYVVHAAKGQRHDILARALLVAENGGWLADVPDVPNLMAGLVQPDPMVQILEELPSRTSTLFLERLTREAGDRVAVVILEVLPRLTTEALETAIAYLLSVQQEAATASRIKQILASRTETADLLLWLCKHLDLATQWQVVVLTDLVSRVLDATALGRRTRAVNHLSEYVGQREWIESLLGRLGDGLPILMERFRETPGSSLVRVFLAGIHRIRPEMAVSAGKPDGVSDGKGAERWTSWRSYRERQAQLRKLMEETIPANSREIGVARSYGDLRENYEYKAAREMQRILLRRQEEWEQDLASVKGCDFGGGSPDRVEMGTSVTIRRPDGRTDCYTILGEWDSDERLGIISNKSRLAEALIGLKAGDEASLPALEPTAGGEQRCVVESVSGLSPEVLEWLKVTGAAPADAVPGHREA